MFQFTIMKPEFHIKSQNPSQLHCNDRHRQTIPLHHNQNMARLTRLASCRLSLQECKSWNTYWWKLLWWYSRLAWSTTKLYHVCTDWHEHCSYILSVYMWINIGMHTQLFMREYSNEVLLKGAYRFTCIMCTGLYKSHAETKTKCLSIMKPVF